MAGDDNQEKTQSQPSSSHSRMWPDDENPFIAFGRFADEQISSALQSVMGLPSLTSYPMKDNWEAGVNNYRHFRNGGGNEDTGNGGASSIGGGSGSSNNKDADDDNNDEDRSWWRRRSDSSSARWLRPSSSDIVNNLDWLLFDSRSWFDDRFPFSFGRFFDAYGSLFPDMIGDCDGSAAWPFAYLMFSPYSPLHLEAHHRRDRYDRGILSSVLSSFRLAPDDSNEPAEPRWREAFEDLLRLENGKPMLDRESTAVASRQKESGKEWLEGLVARGSLGDKWKSVSVGDERCPWTGFSLGSPASNDQQSNGRANVAVSLLTDKDAEEGDKNSTEEESLSSAEADLYDAFLQDIENRHQQVFTESPLMSYLLDQKRRRDESRQPSSVDAAVAEKDTNNKYLTTSQLTESSNFDGPPVEYADEPKPVSTLASTERIRLSDGSVRTKIIRTRRFADGREETKESEEVSNPPSESVPQPSNVQNGSENIKENSKGGWFWK